MSAKISTAIRLQQLVDESAQLVHDMKNASERQPTDRKYDPVHFAPLPPDHFLTEAFNRLRQRFINVLEDLLLGDEHHTDRLIEEIENLQPTASDAKVMFGAILGVRDGHEAGLFESKPSRIDRAARLYILLYEAMMGLSDDVWRGLFDEIDIGPDDVPGETRRDQTMNLIDLARNADELAQLITILTRFGVENLDEIREIGAGWRA